MLQLPWETTTTSSTFKIIRAQLICVDIFYAQAVNLISKTTMLPVQKCFVNSPENINLYETENDYQ